MRFIPTSGLAIMCLLAALNPTSTAQAQGSTNLKTLIMPGALLEGHAKYENECEQCHSPNQKDQQSALCRDCHEAVDADITSRSGFHGQDKEAIKQECRECHSDHKGRGFDPIFLDQNHYDHATSNFPLEGRHKEVDCNSCHTGDTKYRDVDANCASCHDRDAPHSEQISDQCQDCHGTQGWKIAEFDHSSTEFSLSGKHQETTCDACHINLSFSATPTLCVECHAMDDVHETKRGDACADCHSEDQWNESTFDHDSDTDFALMGAHRDANCESCHTNSVAQDKLDSDCHSCHEDRDVHLGVNGTECSACHSEDTWTSVEFDHNDTHFPLKGAHEELSCDNCHQTYRVDLSLSEFDPNNCATCHASDDPHKSGLGDSCNSCHSTASWSKDIRFNHDFTGLPLMGMHAVVQCEECHRNGVFTNSPTYCDACHGSNDPHKGTLGSQCESCHNPNGWNLWIFDHDTQTDYPLTGSHRELDCGQCHTERFRAKQNLGAECVDCHLEDDAHKRRFGTDCARCHVTDSFNQIQVRPQ